MNDDSLTQVQILFMLATLFYSNFKMVGDTGYNLAGSFVCTIKESPKGNNRQKLCPL